LRIFGSFDARVANISGGADVYGLCAPLVGAFSRRLRNSVTDCYFAVPATESTPATVFSNRLSHDRACRLGVPYKGQQY
jgi:hypothetical protein